MKKQPFFALLVTSVLALALGCSSDPDHGDADSGGGSGAAGGATMGGSAGSASGGSPAGATSGGSSPGGSATGGSATGGSGGLAGTGTGAMAGGGVGGGAGTTGACDAACQKLLGAACNTTTQADCVTACDGLITSCPTEAPPYLECVADAASTIMCQDMEAVVAGCDESIDAVAACAVCVPVAEETACGTCTRGSCCAVLQDYIGASDFDGFGPCIDACVDQACVDGCATDFPAAGAVYERLGECQIDTCGESCVCQASADDLACVACAKLNCCADLVPYAAASDVTDFAACIEPCADQSCIDACISDFPVAGAAYGDLLGCIEVDCLADCAQ